jgi:hypothetical protein
MGQDGESNVAINYRLPSGLSIVEASVIPKGILSILDNEIGARLGMIERGGNATITVAVEVGDGVLPPDTPIDELLEHISLAVSAKP